MIVGAVDFLEEAISHQIGLSECFDLEAIIQQVQQAYIKDPYLILWGRSMGAVTAIKYISTQQIKKKSDKVVLAILDSPFLSLKEIIQQTGRNKFNIPYFMSDLIVKYIDSLVLKQAGFTINQFELRNSISLIKCPLILLASKHDGLIPLTHFIQLYELHRGKKTIFYLDETHTDTRSDETVNKVFKAITKYFSVEKNIKKESLQTYRSQIRSRGSNSGKKLSLTSRQFCKQKRCLSQKRRKEIITLKLFNSNNKNNYAANKQLPVTERIGKQNDNIRSKISEFLLNDKRTIKVLKMKKYQSRIQQ